MTHLNTLMYSLVVLLYIITNVVYTSVILHYVRDIIIWRKAFNIYTRAYKELAEKRHISDDDPFGYMHIHKIVNTAYLSDIATMFMATGYLMLVLLSLRELVILTVR